MGVAGRKIPNKGLRGKLQEYFARHPGQTIYLADLMSDVGATTEEAMRTGVSNLRGEVPGWDALVVEIPGRAWVYKPARKAAENGKRVFEELAVTKTGDIIIQDEEGRVYRAVEL